MLARGIHDEADFGKSSRGVTDLGAIPFDMDVLSNFGGPHFWEAITHSLYRSGLVRAWNVFSSKLQIGIDLTVPRVSPVGNERLEAGLGVFSSSDRVFLLYGLLLSM